MVDHARTISKWRKVACVRRAFVLLAALAAPGTAHAGRTFYGWLYGTEVMPERGVELQSWLTEENQSSGDHEVHETQWLLSAQIGVTDQLELGFPVQFGWTLDEAAMPPGGARRTTFDNYGIEARYRFVSQDPVDKPQFAPLVRVAVKRLVAERDTVQPELDLVASYETGIVHVLADIGFYANISGDAQSYELRPGIGVSMLAVAELRFGAELYSEIKFNSDDDWLILGPNLSWTFGRFWISGMYGFGLVGMTNAPRVQWGIAF
jgi:hypothetical protein